MRPDDPNREYLLVIANALGDLCNDVAFVGGSVAGLLLTDPAAEGIRPTQDVDAIVEATSFGQYHQMEKRLPVLGFVRDAGSDLPLEAQEYGRVVRPDADRPGYPGLLQSVVSGGGEDRHARVVG